MYSTNAIPVGLGFDFGDFVKNVTATGLNIYNQHMQLKTVKAIAEARRAAQPVQVIQPVSSQPTTAQPIQVIQPPSVGMSSSWDTNTIITVGGIVVGAVILYSIVRGK